MKIMHPLPRVNEISPLVDETPYAYYFQQAKNGLWIRQGIISILLGKVAS
jgi:aspartate carbamoyltransferase catalytic subunit